MKYFFTEIVAQIQVLMGKYENHLKTAYFTGKMNIITWGQDIYPFLGKHWAFLGLFQSHGRNCFTKNMAHTYVFSNKITKNCYIFLKNARNKCFSSKYRQFSVNFAQIFTFPTRHQLNRQRFGLKQGVHLFQYRRC